MLKESSPKVVVILPVFNKERTTMLTGCLNVPRSLRENSSRQKQSACMEGYFQSFDNRELWRTHDFRELGLTGEAYLTIGDNISYFSDTCRTWNAGNSLRDYIPSKNEQVFANTTDDLIELIERK